MDNDGPFMCQCKVYNQKSIPRLLTAVSQMDCLLSYLKIISDFLYFWMYRYKLELKVVENCHTTRMIFWDDQCKQLLGVKAAELRKTMVDV